MVSFSIYLSLSLSLSLSINLSISLSLLSSIDKRLFDIFRMSVQHARYADTVWSCFAYRVDAGRSRSKNDNDGMQIRLGLKLVSVFYASSTK